MAIMLLYGPYADWWPLLSAPEEYEEEAGAYAAILQSHCTGEIKSVLELGCGGGNNACYLKRTFQMTLSDRSEDMLAVSRALNPECEHSHGDMRTLRLERTFDAVFVQDAIGYMLTEDDLRSTLETAYHHCRAGGVALFVPDYTRETFQPATYHGGHDSEERSLRYLQWDHPMAPNQPGYTIDFAFLLADHRCGRTEVVHDQHRCGLFAIADWYRLLEEVGFSPDSVTLETDELAAGSYRAFIGRKG